jgi:hypothetical protein
MPEYYLTLRLHSDATFGRGEGVAGLVDVEIEHDVYGLPFVGGRALKGLLVEEWANLRYALGGTSEWDETATALFGLPGATEPETTARMRVGAAQLPADLCAAIRQSPMQVGEVLTSLTTIRRQTSLDARDGAPEAASLRSLRVLLRGTPLIAQLDFEREPGERALALLAACTLGVRRGGTGRNRGRGRLALLLHSNVPADFDDATFTRRCFERFAAEVNA